MTKYSIPVLIEYDGGTKSESYIIAKVKDWKGLVLFLTDDHRRLEVLQKYIRHSCRMDPTALALHSDFTKHGVANTEFIWMPGNSKGTIKF
jgi:hypothetical protein